MSPGAGGNGGNAIFNRGTLTTLINNGSLIGGAAGVGIWGTYSGYGINNGGGIAAIGTLTNYGLIQAGSGSFAQQGIYNEGIIGTLNNYGTILGNGGGAGIFNNGSLRGGYITHLVNGQSGLTYRGELPGSYATYFSSSSHYGTISFSSASSYTLGTYGIRIANGQNYAVGTYTGVMSSDSALSVSQLESISGVTYHLVDAGSGTSWNLVIDSVSNSRVASAANAEGNQSGLLAARIIDAHPNLLALFAPLTTNAQLSNGVSATQPLLTGASLSVARHTQDSINSVVNARMDFVNGRSSGESFYGDRHFWIKPFASRADQDDQNGVAGYKADTFGFATGFDGTLSPSLRVGAAFAYAASYVDGNSSVAKNTADIQSYQLIGYGSWSLDERTEVKFQAGLGQNTNQGKRQIAFAGTTASSNYDSQTLHLGASVGRAYALSERTQFTPSVSADYTAIRDEGYQEKGAGLLNLKVNGRSAEALVIGVDGKISHQLTEGTTLTVNGGIGYDTMNKRDSLTSAFAGASNATFVTYGNRPNAVLYRGGVGAVMKLKEGFELTARYDLEHREGFLNQTASANLRWLF